MRILYITPAFQHPAVRGPTRCYYFIKELSKRHAVTLLTLKRTKVSPEAMEEVSSYTEQMLVVDASTNSDGLKKNKVEALSSLTKKTASKKESSNTQPYDSFDEASHIDEELTDRISDICPKCNGHLIKEEGCMTCHSCGYSKCN